MALKLVHFSVLSSFDFDIPPGVGKTHLAIALGREAIPGGYAVQCVTAATLVASMAKAHSERRLEDRLMGASPSRSSDREGARLSASAICL